VAHCNTILAQILKLVPRHEFEALANRHHSGRSFRKASRWSQFTCLVVAQLTGRCSLRDIFECVASQVHRLYHLGCSKLSRSNFARLNENKPHSLYEALFGKLLQRCQTMAPGHDFRFRNPLYSLDGTVIDLCLSVFPWADFHHSKGAIKLHVGLNHAGYLPEFVTVTEGNIYEIGVGKMMEFPKGSIIAIDRGYNDCAWYKELTDKGIFFVTRLKKAADYRVVERRPVNKKQGLTSDQTIAFRGRLTSKKCPIPMRRVGYRDPETGKQYHYLTNNFKLAAKTIADIYKSRWQVELFFKWIKQNLKIKSFVGTSKNAVLTQIWIALCVYLMLAFIKFQSGLKKSMQTILRLLQVNLFEKRDLPALLQGAPPEQRPPGLNQLVLI
jgi:putative transposase